MNIENKTLSAREAFFLETLRKKRLSYLIEPCMFLSKILSQQEYSYLKREYLSVKSLDFKNKVVRYLDKYQIEYKPQKKRNRKKENSDNISKRQDNYIKNQKRMHNKKIQVYVDSRSYEMFLRMVHYKGTNQRKVLEDCLALGSQHWDK